MKQGDLFDAKASQAAKDEAVARVEEGAPDVWKRQALLTVREVCGRMYTFTTDDVWEALATKGMEPSDIEPRALGAIMLNACKAGYCEKADDLPHRLSTRKNCHRRPLQVWRSRIPKVPG